MAKEKVLSPARIALKKLKRNKLAIFGSGVLIILILLAIIAPIISPYGRDTVDLLNIEAAPTAKHILGTDELGRDVFVRLIYGGQVSLSVGVVAIVIQLAIGITLGAIAGYLGGIADKIIMRLVDMVLCFPFLVIAITMASILGPSIWNVMIIIGILGWPKITRIVRAEILSLKEREFIEAAKALGLDSKDIILKHLIHNIYAPIIVYGTLGIAQGILYESFLSFLGMGVTQPQPSWGNMLTAAQNMRVLQSEWWLWIPPGVCVFLTIVSINFLGDGLRDALDPKIKA
ncbi:peptide/nickel transport system permease protein [Clostridium saccharoperbutylacetonicum]|uniref:Oligopeptide transport system permease protein AppC n=1 Tax=Clostridium saccharoperbutylacetonicum N1-4(HMT) TaxID=931276 RepID=M1MUI8_9CLOT|nr:oligopeptide ABC transporter permease [Clostridium saccharoperbutylacetonicum]AGF55207.1 oligopeptide transport system permease protein AppC [Clostridium saccharoperbutylacetonicum N1-4(HMT)]NRT64082.1 peptide/nickel transport system permease protein [Clostridium saccharoperbutylacetonicum]NSB27449.1 peptide/nickel transport system permease protein [Clostridium saccharoperbutylacetonicum]NSB40938.1 peptide/nickel transport system permease protein [Clostridium saccharoperbutylacetonicum]